MALWGKTTNSESRPKFLPVDSNASGSMGARENCIAQPGGWALSAGLASSGNDNTGAQPEILVCIRGLGTSTLQGANVMSIDWTDGEYADAANFDITVTFDEKVTVTSAALTANQTVTNKAYILLSRVGATDMVQDNTIACQYLSGSGTNQLVFRGKLQAAAAGYISFSGLGQDAGDDHVAIVLNGSATIVEEGGDNICKLRQESGTAESSDVGMGGDGILLNGSSGAVATVNGAVSDSATITVDGVSGTIATGQVVTVQDTSSLDISDNGGDTGISTDNSLTITAVASQTSFTVSENITVGNNKVLLLMADGGEDMLTESLEMKFEGVDNATDITGLTRTGGDSEVVMLLEDASNDTGRDTIVLNGTDGSSTNANDNILVEDKTSDIAMYSQVGSSTGTANILAGVTTT
tara:strand:+ start:111 stop:1340 length:1230 start_codon:yes stop_codon:yes gene_type:complete